MSSGVPDDHGGYTIYDLTSGFYSISASLPSSKWFVRSVVLKKGVSNPSNSPEANNVTIDRIEVRSGVNITGLDFMVEVGAATMGGRVTSLQSSILPSQMNAYLVSAAPSSNSNFHLYQTRVKDNRKLEFSNVAPGKYWLLLRAFPDGAATNSALTFSRLDAEARVLLRRQAEAAKTLLDLKECQRVSGYSVRFVAQDAIQ